MFRALFFPGLATAAILGLGGCLLQGGGDTLGAPLRRDWNEVKPPNFTYRLQKSCECPLAEQGTFSVRVAADSVIEAYRLLDDGDSTRLTDGLQAYSIDSLEADLKRRLAAPHDSAHVVYDIGGYYYAESVYVDPNRNAAGDAYGYSIASFWAGPVSRTQVSWAAYKPAAFRYVLARTCFCAPEVTGPFVVTAMADSVESVYRRTGGGDSVAVTAGVQGYSIDSLLADYARRVAAHPDTAAIVYDTAYGFPAHAYVDRNYTLVDDEYGFDVTEFRALPVP